MVRLILQREDDEHQNRASDKLGEELVRFGQERLRIGTEDSRRRGGARRNGSDAGALDGVYGGDVIRVHYAGADEAAEQLGDEVDGEAPPGELPVEAEAECNSRIQEASRVTCDTRGSYISVYPQLLSESRDSLTISLASHPDPT